MKRLVGYALAAATFLQISNSAEANPGRDLDIAIQELEAGRDDLAFRNDTLDALMHLREADRYLERYSDQDQDLYRAENLNDDAIDILRNPFISEFEKINSAVRNIDRAIDFVVRSATYAGYDNGGGYHPPVGGVVMVGSFTKSDYNGQAFNFNLSPYTQNRAFTQIVFDVRVGETHAPIVNTIKVRSNGQWLETTIGARLNAGMNVFSLNVPRGATEIRISTDHGKNASVNVSLR